MYNACATESSGYVYKPDMTRAASIALRAFRDGKLGKVNLDIGLIEHMKVHGEDDESSMRSALKQREQERIKTVLEARVNNNIDQYPQEFTPPVQRTMQSLPASRQSLNETADEFSPERK